MSERKKIAAIITTYYPLSTTQTVIATKYMKGFPTDEGLQEPRVDLV